MFLEIAEHFSIADFLLPFSLSLSLSLTLSLSHSHTHSFSLVGCSALQILHTSVTGPGGRDRRPLVAYELDTCPQSIFRFLHGGLQRQRSNAGGINWHDLGLVVFVASRLAL
jgi:hypothetical protein